MNETEISERYFDWIYERLERNSVSHRRLFALMYDYKFVAKVHKDFNRVEECRRSRSEHLRRLGANLEAHHEWASGLVSVLEMLYHLALIMEFETDMPRRTWFWHLLDNLGLSEMSDDISFEDEAVHNRLDKFVERKYNKDGEGGIFPMQNTSLDQRRVELWYQLNEYILEDRYAFTE